MTAIALALKTPVSRFAALGRYFADVFAGIAEGQELALRYERLSRLSDEALAARGISRDELPQAVAAGRIRG